MENFNVNKFTVKVAENFREGRFDLIKNNRKEIAEVLRENNPSQELKEHLKVLDGILKDKLEKNGY